MKTKCLVLVLLALALSLGVVASPAGAATMGLPHVAQPSVAYVIPLDGSWWSGGYGWGGFTAHAAGTPIPAQDYIIVNVEWIDPSRALVASMPQWELFSVTVKSGNRVLLRTSEAQSAQFWTDVAWDPTMAGWFRQWDVPIGRLPAGDYQITFVDHLTTTVEGSLLDENGAWYPAVVKPYKDTYKASFSVR
jgi:hypothetical protein